jgi:hypothetical protein
MVIPVEQGSNHLLRMCGTPRTPLVLIRWSHGVRQLLSTPWRHLRFDTEGSTQTATVKQYPAPRVAYVPLLTSPCCASTSAGRYAARERRLGEPRRLKAGPLGFATSQLSECSKSVHVYSDVRLSSIHKTTMFIVVRPRRVSSDFAMIGMIDRYLFQDALQAEVTLFYSACSAKGD